MMKMINNFWYEHGRQICSGFVCTILMVSVMTIPYLKYLPL